MVEAIRSAICFWSVVRFPFTFKWDIAVEKIVTLDIYTYILIFFILYSSCDQINKSNKETSKTHTHIEQVIINNKVSQRIRLGLCIHPWQ